MSPQNNSHTAGMASDTYATAPAAAVPPLEPSASPAVARDNDVIENEWVDAAKRIVADNAADPFSQNQAIMQLRRAYLKKRYGMDTGITK